MPDQPDRPSLHSDYPAAVTAVLEQISDALFALDHDWGFTYVNREAERLLGRPRAALMGRNIWVEFPRIVGSEFDRQYRRARDTNETVEFETHFSPHDAWYRVRVYPSEAGLTVFVRDVSTQKKAQEELHRSEQRFRTVVESMGEGLLLMDREGCIVHANPRAEEILGWRLEELVGHVVSEIFVTEARREEQRTRLERRLLGDAERYELEVRHRDGRHIWLEIHAAPAQDASGEISGSVAAFADITERRRLEELLRQTYKMEAVGRLAGGVAHDFNNMLTAIQGFASLLEFGAEDEEEQRTFIREIKKAAERSASLTRQLLAFSRQQVLRPEPVDLNGVVRDLEGMLHRLIGENVRLVVSPGREVDLVVGDRGQLEQVLINLAVNARDAMPGGGTLAIETANARISREEAEGYPYPVAPGAYVRISVRDTGVGMDEATLARVFEPFFTTKEVGQGTGLGLSTAYGIVKQSGGYIWVDSAPGQGSCFRVYLPRADAATPEAEALAEEGARPPAASATVLVVEDEPSVLSLVGTVLEREGYQVLRARNGAEALVHAARHRAPLDLLLTDVIMPAMSGREVAERLQERQPDLRVLFMSGHTEDQALLGRIREEGWPFLQKPIRPDHLLRRIREVLDQEPA